MSLSTRVFVFFAALMVLMLGSQWYMMRTITNDVSSELGKVGFSVAKDTASFFILNDFQWFGGTAIDQRVERRSSFSTATGSSNESITVIQTPPPTVQVKINNQQRAAVAQRYTAGNFRAVDACALHTGTVGYFCRNCAYQAGDVVECAV